MNLTSLVEKTISLSYGINLNRKLQDGKKNQETFEVHRIGYKTQFVE